MQGGCESQQVAGSRADRRCRGGQLGRPSDSGQERPLSPLLLEMQSHWHCSFPEAALPASSSPAPRGTGGGEERRGTRAWGEAMAGGMEGAGGSRGRAGVPLPGLDEIR